MRSLVQVASARRNNPRRARGQVHFANNRKTGINPFLVSLLSLSLSLSSFSSSVQCSNRTLAREFSAVTRCTTASLSVYTLAARIRRRRRRRRLTSAQQSSLAERASAWSIFVPFASRHAAEFSSLLCMCKYMFVCRAPRLRELCAF